MLYDGSKGAVTSSILITPNASQVAKVLRGGAAGFALTLAVEQLLGAVDWVLDPANSKIRYKDQSDLTSTAYGFIIPINNTSVLYGFTKENVCSKYFNYYSKQYPLNTNDSQKNSYRQELKDNSCYVHAMPLNVQASYVLIYNNSNYNPNQEKTLSLETVAQKVIENAESDNLDAQFAVLAAANNILSEAENDDAKRKPIEDELENNAKCPSGIVRNGSCWICDKSQFMPITRATRDAKTATRYKGCNSSTDLTTKAANAILFRNLINARVQENACWLPPDPNHILRLAEDRNALSNCEN
ncbi:hypothetical protein SFB21_0721 [Acinetobacter bouvetii]|uniref:Uncharacterized protein n=2 Tax=Acinetobacter bouvetii TaxID=202951 RepID=A0A811G777_9GAMM|nr:hypothetical protein SFB21_0721 [Acinetobacter bouvetii]